MHIFKTYISKEYISNTRMCTPIAGKEKDEIIEKLINQSSKQVHRRGVLPKLIRAMN